MAESGASLAKEKSSTNMNSGSQRNSQTALQIKPTGGCKLNSTCNINELMKSSYSCCPSSPLSGFRYPPPSSSYLPQKSSLPSRCFRCCEVTSKPIIPCIPCSPKPFRPLLSCCPAPPCKPSPCCPPSPCKPSPCCPPPPCSPPRCDTPQKVDTPKKVDTPQKIDTPPRAKTPPKQEEVPEKEIPRNPCPPSPPIPHCCPEDVEIERAKGFIEHITGPETWKKYGVRIAYTDPLSPGTSSVKLGSLLKVKLAIDVKANSCLCPDIISAYMWTHMRLMCNPCGTWKDLPLHFQPDQTTEGECGIKRYVYTSTLSPVDTAIYRLTFNIKWGQYLIWANNYGDDNFVGVSK